jgi:type VI secretion system protein VasG
MHVNLRSLIGKLNPKTRNAVEAAAGLCLSRTHYDVEIEHFMLKLMDATDSDLAAILKHYEINRSRFAAELTESLDRLKTGNARTPSLSPSLVRMLTDAWTLGSVEYDSGQIRSGYAVLALTANEELSRMFRDVSREFQKVNVEDLRTKFHDIVATSSEDAAAYTESGSTGAIGDGAARKGDGKTPNLDQFTTNLTQRARDGLMDPVLGRDFEIRQVVDILTRRRQNNPILVGEAGVGKTAVVEGFAIRIAQGDVPPVLRNVTVHGLDLALLQAGAGVKGEFENRLKGLMAEVRSSPTPIILFIDEAHTMIGAGGAAGQGDAANLLKPALARGELRTLAATTWSEYKKYFEKDPALARRFQVVKIDEPDEATCMVMMRGVVPFLERHHKVRVLDDGVHAAVRLSHRYLADRQLPDKAVSVLDTACARLALGQNSTPAPIEDVQRQLDDLEVQARVLSREQVTGVDHSERLELIAAQRVVLQDRLAALTRRWEKERALVSTARGLRDRLEELMGVRAASEADRSDTSTGDGESQAPDAVEGRDAETVVGDGSVADGSPGPDADGLRAELAAVNAELEELQGEEPLVPVNVDGELVGQVISGWTGIPVGKMLRDDLAVALELEQYLGKRIIGQDHALEIISHRIRTSRAGIEDPKKPVGVFLLVGPSGVGKTETALVLSDMLYGGERNLITINMSEFQEPHTVSTLKGAPPGYVGYGEGGVLTEAVRRRPYSLVLLDEIEKAHPDVLELFFQVFDKGVMDDGEGREIDFKNCVILLTTNAGTDTLMKLCADPETMPRHEGLVKALKPELNQVFKPAFLGRTVIIPYFPVRDEALKTIIRLKVGRIQDRLRQSHRVELVLDEAVHDAIAERCTEVESGARNVDNILTNTMLPAVSKLLLHALVEENPPGAIRVGVGEDGDFSYSAEGMLESAAEPLSAAVPAAG